MIPYRVVVAATGASGAAIALRIMERLSISGAVEAHLIVSNAAQRTLQHELGEKAYEDMISLATRSYLISDIGATLASGSFATSGMIIAPCSMRTLAAIATGLSDNLITRTADVHLKERRRLVLVARETPLHLGHLRNMCAVTEMGAIVMPPVPAFYNLPQTVSEIVDHIAARAIDLLSLPIIQQSAAWEGQS